jgi:CheY-like chemotaxis protein/anti-sigma regulatory factor (Ser/Thr protein kinase)
MPAGLYGDDVRIRQIIMNLLSNAIKYTKEGSVSLRMDFNYSDLDKKTGYLNVGVIDTGIGIKKEDIPKLAKAFSRVDEERNRNIKGTGLGLAITSSLLNLMGSKLQIESTYGLGSTFFFSVWQTVTDATPLKEKEFSKEANKEKFVATTADVLVVDDNKVNFAVCKGLMKYYGFTPDFASGGKECLKMIQEKKYDIIFLDHQMPEMNGIETLEKIKELYPNIYKDTPVVALTANESAHSKSEYLGYGFRDYLSKPIDADRLHNILGTYLPKEKVAYLNR